MNNIDSEIDSIKETNDDSTWNILGWMFLVFVFFGGAFFVWNIAKEIVSSEEFAATVITFLSILLTFFISKTVLLKQNENKKIDILKNRWKQNYSSNSRQYQKELENTNKNWQQDYDNLCEYANEISKENECIKENLTKGFLYISDFIADINTVNYEFAAKYLKNKKHPAVSEAMRIQELKKETKEYIKQYKLMRYEYDMLFSLFPELENYIEYYSFEQQKTIEDIKENYDYVKSWVSKEEYEALDENSRNQLALDRYIESRNKSKWAIGRDYEMFIGYEYEKLGYKVEYTGITERLEDKGRDLIARKGNETLIIQCKNWSKYKEVHENHICQLFGTTVQYNIEHNSLFKATPVFITSATLSNTALKFADYLGVQVIQNKKLAPFPRIKCNINKEGKIYHLPFDQQYDRTIIGNQNGEFFAWTVQEAVQKGFRRAKKHFYVK